MQTSGPRLTFERRGQFAWKVGLLLATTIALIPILLSKHELAATIYLWILVVIHVAGLFIIGIGVKRDHIAPNKRGLYSRLIGIALLIALLYLASKGLQSSVEGWLFWGSLFAIWALHTVGLALLHIRSRSENAALCPFV
jgi:hypothetical protein